MTLERKSRRGFTLIELLLVIVILGIVSALLIPNLLDSLQKSKQKRTMTDMNGVGLAWMSWLTDEVSAAAAGASQTFDFEAALPTSLSSADLLQTLWLSDDLFYAKIVPRTDGWGTPFDYRWAGNLTSASLMGIRSYGRDKVAGPTVPYPAGAFVTTDYDQDMIWVDGFFYRFPRGVQVN